MRQGYGSGRNNYGTTLLVLCPELWIRDPVIFCPLDPGSGMGKKSGSRIRDEHPESYFLMLRNNFLG
jgi:hypothetical protein